MEEEKEIRVEYKREGDDGHFLSTGFKPLPDIKIDYTGIPQDQRGGTATRLLCASALYCFASTLGSSLVARGVKIRSMSGKAVAQKAQDDYKRTKVERIRIEIEVDVDDADIPTLEKCKVIAERGCLISYSLEGGVEVEKVIRRFKTT